ncbi:MAG: hypothetical protein KGP35_03110, partial [Bacteroidetes bacterium]|nr:hypothetical protein [Bacteroidota bacterium]
DYVKKDSLEQKRKDPHYLDSVDRVRNKVKWADILLLGKSISQERKKRTYEWEPLLNAVSFYPGEGFVVDMPLEITQRVTDRKRHVLIPHLRYGFASERLYGWGTYKYFGGKKYLSTFSLSGGSRPFQYNPDNPVDPFVNSFYALRSEDNYLKIYAANYVRAAFSKGVGNGLILRGVLSYQERIPFDNATDFSWQKTNNKTYSPNFPNEVLTAPFQRHEALSFTVGLQYQPQTSYIEFPDRIVNIGSKWPLLNLQYTKGIPNLLGSNVDYDKWQAELQDEWNLRLFGTFNWKYKAGGFLNTSNAPIQDWQHFAGNRFNFSGDFLNTFQLPEYYQFSNTASLFNAVFAEYHLNGFLTNKLPFFNKLNWHLVTGARALWFNQQSYSEWNIGLENIFKILRIDMICGVLNGNRITPDWRIGTKINLSRKED